MALRRFRIIGRAAPGWNRGHWGDVMLREGVDSTRRHLGLGKCSIGAKDRFVAKCLKMARYANVLAQVECHEGWGPVHKKDVTCGTF
jgi:hypothetical protein